MFLMTYEQMIEEVMNEKPDAFSVANQELHDLCVQVSLAIRADDHFGVPSVETFLQQAGRLQVWLDLKGKTVSAFRRM